MKKLILFFTMYIDICAFFCLTSFFLSLIRGNDLLFSTNGCSIEISLGARMFIAHFVIKIMVPFKNDINNCR